VHSVLEAVGAGEPAPLEPLAGGTHNTGTRAAFGDGRDWVVKIPPAHATGRSYVQRPLVNEATL
ncbi:aminoglycoside phosphotransferase family protein, partial [Streptomyces sp. JAC25]